MVRKRRTQEAIAREIDVSALSNAPQQRRSQELSIRILEAAERVLHRDGLAAFTIGAVASEAGVSVGGIYGRFKNREELLAAIHGEALARIELVIESAMRQRFGSLAEVVDAFATRAVAVFRDLGSLLPAISKTADAATVNRVERNIRLALWAAVEPFKSEVRHPDPELAVRLVTHLMLASLTRESGSPASSIDRRMGWDNLAHELPPAMRAILLSAY